MGYIVNFNLGIDPHSVTVNDVTSNSATILIKSTTITTTLFANDTKTFDLNLNNKTDFSITLLKISGGKADLLLKSIPETSAGAPPNMPNATFTPNMTGGNMTNITNKTNATNATAKQGAQFSLESKALIIIISVIAAIAIGAAIGATIALLKIRKKNYWKKERTDWHKPKRMDYEYS
jgi:cell division protein FtsL